jgi:hypothetical protein
MGHHVLIRGVADREGLVLDPKSERTEPIRDQPGGLLKLEQVLAIALTDGRGQGCHVRSQTIDHGRLSLRIAGSHMDAAMPLEYARCMSMAGAPHFDATFPSFVRRARKARKDSKPAKRRNRPLRVAPSKEDATAFFRRALLLER